MILSGEDILLVRRGNEPSRGRWGLPGGVVELGETVEEAIVREVAEETCIRVRPVRLLAVLDSITMDQEGKTRFHYVLTEFLCERVEGDLNASSDVSEAKWFPLNEICSLRMSEWTRGFIEKVAREENIL